VTDCKKELQIAVRMSSGGAARAIGPTTQMDQLMKKAFLKNDTARILNKKP
jgi:hypothetical protein